MPGTTDALDGEDANPSPTDGSAGVPAARAGSGLGYRPALDGLRAFAVVAVLLFHADLEWARGGYLGVDAFFVLSGFLITSLLVGEHRGSGRIDLREFYTRRARRLLPAIIVLVAVMALFAWLFASASQARNLRGDSLATLFYYANWRQVLSPAGYFEMFQAPSPLRHTWSLAVEEQWYIVWPLALVGIAALCRGRVRRMFFVIAGLAVAGAVWTALLAHPGQDPSRVYYGTDTRAHELLVGAALALLFAWLLPRWTATTDGRATTADRVLHGAAIVAVVALLVCWSQVDGRSAWLYEGGLLLLALGVALVIASSLRPGSPVGRALSWRPFVLVGLISYALYLWHWPVYLVLTPTRTGLDGYALLAVRLAVATVLAIGSYLLIEQPFRHQRLSGVRLVAVLGAAVVLAVGVVMVATVGVAPAPVTTASRPHASKSVPPVPGAPTVYVLGDSVTMTVADGLERTADGRFTVVNRTELGCGVFPGPIADDPRAQRDTACIGWRQQWDAELRRDPPDQLVLGFGLWDGYDREVVGDRVPFRSAKWAKLLDRALERDLERLSPEVRSVVLLNLPCSRPAGDALTVHEHANLYDPASVRWFERQLAAFAARHAPRVEYVDLKAVACPGGEFLAESGGQRLRIDDGVHFTAAGGDWVAVRLAPLLDGALDAAVGTPTTTSTPAGAGPAPTSVPTTRG